MPVACGRQFVVLLFDCVEHYVHVSLKDFYIVCQIIFVFLRNAVVCHNVESDIHFLVIGAYRIHHHTRWHDESMIKAYYDIHFLL